MAGLLPPERDIGVVRGSARSGFALSGAFLILLLALGLEERVGGPTGTVSVVALAGALALFALAGLTAHGRRPVDFYVADRRIGAVLGGVASASGLAGLLLLGVLGGAYSAQSEVIAAALGLSLGVLTAALCVAPALRRFGAYTAGDFLAARFGGGWARLVIAAVAFCASLLLLLAHLRIAAPLLATLLGLTPRNALYLTVAVTVMPLLPGGMRSLTATQAVQYFVLLLGCLAPAAFLTLRGGTAGEAPEFAALLAGNLLNGSAAIAGGHVVPILFLALGAAALPHLNVRALAATSGRTAGVSMIWTVLHFLLLAIAGLVLAQLVAAAGGADTFAGGPDEVLQLAALFAALPAVLAGLVLAGALAALFSLGQAALLAATTAVSHDLWDETIDAAGPEGRRLIVARLLLIGIAAIAGLLSAYLSLEGGALMEWALALAAAGGFVPLVLGIWWKRCNEIGAIGGAVAGFGTTALAFVLEQGVVPGGAQISALAGLGVAHAALLGTGLAFIIAVSVSLLTPAPEADLAGLFATLRGDKAGAGMRERPA